MRGLRPAEVANDAGIEWPVINQAVDARDWSPNEARAYLDASTTPIILVLSKAAPYDPKGVWLTLMQQRGATELARLTAFSIYEWQPEGTSAKTASLQP